MYACFSLKPRPLFPEALNTNYLGFPVAQRENRPVVQQPFLGKLKSCKACKKQISVFVEARKGKSKSCKACKKQISVFVEAWGLTRKCPNRILFSGHLGRAFLRIAAGRDFTVPRVQQGGISQFLQSDAHSKVHFDSRGRRSTAWTRKKETTPVTSSLRLD